MVPMQFKEASDVRWHDTPWMWLSMLVFWSLFAVFAYYAIRGWPTAAQSDPRAAAILEERYARGEISAEEYGERRETIEASRTPRRER